MQWKHRDVYSWGHWAGFQLTLGVKHTFLREKTEIRNANTFLKRTSCFWMGLYILCDLLQDMEGCVSMHCTRVLAERMRRAETQLVLLASRCDSGVWLHPSTQRAYFSTQRRHLLPKHDSSCPRGCECAWTGLRSLQGTGWQPLSFHSLLGISPLPQPQTLGDNRFSCCTFFLPYLDLVQALFKVSRKIITFSALYLSPQSQVKHASLHANNVLWTQPFL